GGYGPVPILPELHVISQLPNALALRIHAIKGLDHVRRLQRPLDLCPGPPDRQPAGRGAYLTGRRDGGQASKDLSKKSSGEWASEFLGPIYFWVGSYKR